MLLFVDCCVVRGVCCVVVRWLLICLRLCLVVCCLLFGGCCMSGVVRLVSLLCLVFCRVASLRAVGCDALLVVCCVLFVDCSL